MTAEVQAKCTQDFESGWFLSCAGMQPLLLDTQYRMHPLIADFPSAHFYAGLLHSGISAEDRPLPKGVASIISCRLLLLATWTQAFGVQSQGAQENFVCSIPCILDV